MSYSDLVLIQAAASTAAVVVMIWQICAYHRTRKKVNETLRVIDEAVSLINAERESISRHYDERKAWIDDLIVGVNEKAYALRSHN